MTRRTPITITLAVMIAATASCSSDNATTATSTSTPATTTSADTAAPTTQPTSATRSSTSTSPTTPTTPAPSTTGTPTTDAEPTVTTTGASTEPTPGTAPVGEEDWVAVIQDLVNIRAELYATSDPSRAGEVCADTAPCYQQLVTQLTDAQSKGWHVVDQKPLTIISAELEQHTNNDGIELAVVRAVVKRTTQYGHVVDADGNTVYDISPEDPDRPTNGEIRWTLIRLSAGWRILDQDTIS